jgi:hypothetical protein
MNIIEAVRASDKIQEAREAMKFLCGDDYPKRVEVYTKAIVGTARQNKCSHLQALIILSKRPELSDGVCIAMMFAAYAELTENGIV